MLLEKIFLMWLLLCLDAGVVQLCAAVGVVL